jgi:hypothetical protein
LRQFDSQLVSASLLSTLPPPDPAAHSTPPPLRKTDNPPLPTEIYSNTSTDPDVWSKGPPTSNPSLVAKSLNDCRSGIGHHK